MVPTLLAELDPVVESFLAELALEPKTSCTADTAVIAVGLDARKGC